MRKGGKNNIAYKADVEETADSDCEFCLSPSINWATSILWQASVPLGISRLCISYVILSLFSMFCFIFIKFGCTHSRCLFLCEE
ncbi:uncharacterized protein LOC110229860 [Arabidopsis lyrata subsp. lyrata]|uniref:uncharacterized protein LOC110229860 n=1 Tax=Arabidopsis lyrata subsp. lyrata TaxID=81972 RepID=UPI000A29E495|nr:uncharacterized protein LOC110229860 [Arabidopsis lyrata subsp. lyrata]|eukprot:XP_020886578.1 uncharacterized protein LOC110229860 [Arabidopsis lyrata subsp. lyrata]